MDNRKIKYILVSMWVVGFMFCATITLTFYKYLPEKFGELLNHVFDSFSPQLATMLAFVFSDQMLAEEKEKVNYFAAYLAIFLSAAYILFFCWLMVSFYLGSHRVVDVIDMINMVRPKTTFIMTGIIAYYFASRK